MPDHSVLVLFAHPALRRSRVQRVLRDAAALPGVTVHDLYEAYPDFDIDVDAEQALLRDHDTVLFQHPLYWYSVPPLLKQWFDLVLEHGWAYGTGGRALAGKQAGVAVSAGGRATAYAREGLNRFTLQEFLRPVEATARLCGMVWLPPFLVTGTHAMDERAIGAAATAYARWLRLLTERRLDGDQLRAADATTLAEGG